MAEILGVISGGAGLASLALQLGDSAVKARRLFHAAKDAPETLQHIAFEMETFSLVLHEVSRHSQTYPSRPDILARCAQMCRQSVTRIQAIVNKLETLINRHSRLGRLRTAVEEKELSKVCSELERAKTSLGISLQLYSEYQRAMDRDIIRANYQLASDQTRLLQTQANSLADLRTAMSISSIPAASENLVTETDLDDATAAKRRSSQRSLHIKQYRFRLRPWFVAAMWDLRIRKTLAGWDVQLRTTNLVPEDSEIFHRCRDGDLDGVRKMFQRGLASPYDEAPDFHSVLRDTMRSRNLALCRFVLESLDIDVFDPRMVQDSLSLYAWTGKYLRFDVDDSSSIDMYRLFTCYLDPTEDVLFQGYLWEWIRNLECMKLAQNALPIPYMGLPWQTRFEHAMALAISEPNVAAEMLLQPLGCGPSDVRLINSKNVHGLTVFHAIAIAAGSRTWEQLEAGSWVELARNYVDGGGCIHPQDVSGGSPLTYIIGNSNRKSHRNPCEEIRLLIWVCLLQTIGIDLALYGEREVIIWQNYLDNYKPERAYHEPYWVGELETDSRGVGEWFYGAKIEDWSLTIYRVDYIPVFEAVVPTMPGTWEGASDDKDECPSTIIWRPMKEDDSALQFPSFWRGVRVQRLASGPFPALRAQQQQMADGFWDCVETKAQDDASEIMRLLETTRRHVNRPRSQSQPPLRDQRVASQTFAQLPRHFWLPTYHICVCDSRRRLAPCAGRPKYSWLTSFRRCMRGQHQTVDIWKYIDRRMRHFRRKFRTREELKRLPYQVYKADDHDVQFDDWREYTDNCYDW